MSLMLKPAMDADEINGEKFVIGGVYLDYPNREWMGKVISRTPSSIRMVIKGKRERAYRTSEAVTIRINPPASREWDCEVAMQGGGGWDGWEFHAEDKA